MSEVPPNDDSLTDLLDAVLGRPPATPGKAA
jgi:hypothetical protein